MKIFSAQYLLPISSEPIINSAIAVEKDKIIAVGKTSELKQKFPEATYKDFGEAVIMPGFVNCHSHLEITAMRGFLDDLDGDFYSWLIRLTKARAEKLSEADIETSAILGGLEGVRAGVTCFGDIGRWGKAGFNALKLNGLRGILFQETEFSPDNETANGDFLKLEEKFLTLKEKETEIVKVGISPHAPYTVSQKLFETITDYALAENIKLTIHAAESVQEKNLMLNGEGFFAELYHKQNIKWTTPKMSSIEYFSEIGVLEAKPLLAHCVKVSDKDIDLIVASNSAIAHCPKSNAKFGHGIAPLEKFFEQSICVGIGSDSMASNNTCDLLEEARFATILARTREDTKHFLDAKKMIETATLGGAKALGLENEIGTIEVGKQADIIAISLSEVAQMPVHNIYSTLLFATNARDVVYTMVAGEELFSEGKINRLDEAELKGKMKKIAEKMRE